MKRQPHRLNADTQHSFIGSAIDRNRPIRFRLNGVQMDGFAGDTVLSAALANGIDSFGLRDEHPIALTSQAEPAVLLAGRVNASGPALPMARTLVSDGADYVSFGPLTHGGPLGLFGRRSPRSLNVDLDKLVQSASATSSVSNVLEFDLAVVGGGIAGMAAALAGSRRRYRVLLVEETPELGGLAPLFGTLEGDEPPLTSITRLQADVAASSNIQVMTCTKAVDISSGRLRLHNVHSQANVVASEIIEIVAPRIVIATGAVERLPIFAGNRLPGVVGLAEAYLMATRYGVWPGQSALISASTSLGYRLAMLARDAGIDIARVLDSRQTPQSRFIEFSKAYGITRAPGTIAASARAQNNARGVVVTPKLSIEAFSRFEEQITVDRLVISGNWQPNLSLWVMCGGQVIWSCEQNQFMPYGDVVGIGVAGGAAGWETRSACEDSGIAAVDRLAKRKPRCVREQAVDRRHESEDGPTPIGLTGSPNGPAAYFADGAGFVCREQVSQGIRRKFSPINAPSIDQLDDVTQSLDITEIASAVQLGLISAVRAQGMVHERIPKRAFAQANLEPADLPAPDDLPDYLHARYPDAKLWQVAPLEPRQLPVGGLIYASQDNTNPLQAQGVIISAEANSALALCTGKKDQVLNLKAADRTIAVRLVARHRPV
jgi:sarcosine oxidase subunit alpha